MIFGKVVASYNILLISVISTSILVHLENPRVYINISDRLKVFFSHLSCRIESSNY